MDEALEPSKEEEVLAVRKLSVGSDVPVGEGVNGSYDMHMHIMTQEAVKNRRAASSLEYGMNIINGIIFAVGAMNIIFGVFVLSSGLLSLCDGCKPLATASVVLGVLTVIFAITGGFVSRRRSANLLLFYVMMMIIIAMSTTGLTVAVIVFDTMGYNFGYEWQQLIKRDQQSICDVQDRYECSGWSKCCGSPDSQNQTCEWIDTECTAQCLNDYTDSCSAAVGDGLHGRMMPFTAVLVGGLVFICGSLFCIIKLKKKPRESERQSNYLELEL
eukprot:TRINITY_DN14025_c0_g1_i1.p2 TRINITY_DN14025_c0_g1~~TRINITY_DN14025_c0_g1_i1.p2  ORF type:complete len:284 (+),score=93.41 TRINITY_DN14025_c0_g1_i1:38-853(+)